MKGDIYYFGNLNEGVIMDNKTIKTLFVIASAGLAIAGIIFLCISIFGDKSNNNSLIAALGCIALSNLFNVVRGLNEKSK